MQENNHKRRDKKQKIIYLDDGRSVADMSRISKFGHIYSDAQLSARQRKKQANDKKNKIVLSKEERRAAFFGGLRAAIPAFLMLLAVCAITFGIIYLWFRP